MHVICILHLKPRAFLSHKAFENCKSHVSFNSSDNIILRHNHISGHSFLFTECSVASFRWWYWEYPQERYWLTLRVHVSAVWVLKISRFLIITDHLLWVTDHTDNRGNCRWTICRWHSHWIYNEFSTLKIPTQNCKLWYRVRQISFFFGKCFKKTTEYFLKFLKFLFFFDKIGIFCKLICRDISQRCSSVYTSREDKTNYLSNQTL